MGFQEKAIGHFDHEGMNNPEAAEADDRGIEEGVVANEFGAELIDEVARNNGLGSRLQPDMSVRTQDHMHAKHVILNGADIDRGTMGARWTWRRQGFARCSLPTSAASAPPLFPGCG